MTKRKLVNDPQIAKTVLSFISNGIDDYIAARVLFNSGLPQQGAVLSSTAIEKWLKALMALNGNQSHGHLKKAHWNALRNFDAALYATLNEQFLELNQRIYKIRYTDDLPTEYNAVIASREFLAELDYSIFQFNSKLTFTRQSGQTVTTKLGDMIETNDQRLYCENYVLANEEKESFIYRKPQLVYEVRNLGENNLLEATYSTCSKPRDPSFSRAAWVPKDQSGKSFDLSFMPIQ